jgi:ubiquinone/menaquinone biosynthesis C-methylase UbiE
MSKSTKTPEEIALAYKSPPWWYNLRGFFILNTSYRNTLFLHIIFFSRNMGQEHLDVAVGTGTLLQMIMWWRKICFAPKIKIVGVDYAESMLAGAIQTFKNNKDLTFKLEDVAHMSFADDTFDTVNVANALHCFPDVEGGLREIYRVIKPGGTVAVNVLLYPRSGGDFCMKIAKRINDWGIRKGILYTPYEKDDIRARFLKAGFVIEYENVTGNCYCVVMRKPGR